MTFDLTDEEAAALLKELDKIIDGDRFQFSARVRTLKAIRAKIRPEPVREPLPPPPKQYAPPRATAAKRRRGGRLAHRQTRRKSSIHAMTSPALQPMSDSNANAPRVESFE